MTSSMPFFLPLLKACFVAFVIVSATLIAEKAKPLYASLVLSLPVSAGPTYILLSFEQSDDFMAKASLVSTGANITTLSFVFGYALTALRGFSLLPSLLAGYLLWALVAYCVSGLTMSLALSLSLNILFFSGLGFILWRFRENLPPATVHKKWYDIPLRVMIVVSLVLFIVNFAEWLGTQYTGVIALFPASYSSFILLMHHRLGGKRVATIMINGFLSLIGFVGGLYALHLFSLNGRVGLGLTFMVLVPVLFSGGVLGYNLYKK